jgi:hypothetical protein
MTTRQRLAVEELEPRDVPAAAPFDTLPVLPADDPGVLDTARAILTAGQTLGRRTDVFLKVGDSNTDAGPAVEVGYLRPLGSNDYDPTTTGLAGYGQPLLDTLAAFRSPVDGTSNSFTRYDHTAQPGFQVTSVLPLLAGEVSATDAGVALVMLGTNDLAAGTSPDQFRANLTRLVSTLANDGVVPVLSTIPDSTINGGARAALVRTFNQVIADVAADNHVPLWNLFGQLESLPGAGISPDGVHLNASPLGAGDLTAVSLAYGQNVHNLGALQVLDWYREQVVGGAGAVLPPLPGWFRLDPGRQVYAVGRGAGQPPVVSVYDLASGRELNRFLAFEPTFTGGVRVAVADVNGDGVPDVVAAPGSGGGPVVKVFSGVDGSLIGSVLAFEPSFRTGVTVAAADLDGDGKAEVVVGAGNGGGPAVAVFHGGDLTEVERFFAYEPSFRGGVNVAAADLAGYGPSIVVGSGVGGGPVVKVFRYGALNPAVSFYVFEPGVRDGVQVAAGSLTGDGLAEIATAPESGSTRVRVIDPQTGSGLSSIFAGQPEVVGGVSLAIRGGKLLAGSGPGSGVSVEAYSGLSTTPVFFPPEDTTRAYGVNVG